MFFGAQAVGALASVAISLRDPISYRLGRRLELPSQLSRCTSGPNQLDHLLSECRRVRRSRLRHRGLLLLLAKRIGVRGTGSTPLASYATYKAYWRLLKKIEDDPRYDKRKAEHLLKSFVELHPHAIGEKVAVCVEHFAAQAANEIGGRAKAMIVTRSRLHAVRTRIALDGYLAEKGHPWKALVAFSGTVTDGGESYTESGMNSAGQDRVISDRQTAAEFEKPEHRFLVVASKFQTGFDQPLLHTMYVDKKLGGVNAVQTLSRLNRMHPGKPGTMVLDFANEADEIKKAFEPYYETTLLSEETDPNLL